jgi:biotin synthase-like enzyme
MEPSIYRNDLFKSELEKMFTENKLDKEKVSQMSNIIKNYYKNKKIESSKLFSIEKEKMKK